jgi:hypothetical protein
MSDQKKMLILRGNDSPAGTFPDEQGKKIAWPIGALHVEATKKYARSLGYEPVVFDISGRQQSLHSPQTNAAVAAFLDVKDQADTGLYGFSGGGYNVRYVLARLAAEAPLSLHHIDRVVVIGSPNKLKKQGGDLYKPAIFNEVAKAAAAKIKDATFEPADWDLIFRENPDPSQLPRGLPKGTPTHMFGPDLLLAGWPE